MSSETIYTCDACGKVTDSSELFLVCVESDSYEMTAPRERFSADVCSNCLPSRMNLLRAALNKDTKP